MSLQPFTLFSFNISACGFVLVGPKNNNTSEPHQCQCGSVVDARGLHSFFCKRAPDRSARHHALNDLVARSLATAGVPVTKEPAGLFRTDGKRPNGLTLVPRESAKSLCCYVTVICPLAESYVSGAAQR